MILARRNFNEKKEKIVLLQALCRGMLCRQQMKRRVTASLALQRWWRGVQLTRRVQEEYKETRQKIILVQSLVRKRSEQRNYQNLRTKTILLQKTVRTKKLSE